MKKYQFLMEGFFIMALVICFAVPVSQALTKEEKQFMKEHRKEMTTFMEKCSGCHSLQRILTKERPKEEWDKVLKIMAGKPHANISDKELKDIQKWVDFMRAIPE